MKRFGIIAGLGLAFVAGYVFRSSAPSDTPRARPPDAPRTADDVPPPPTERSHTDTYRSVFESGTAEDIVRRLSPVSPPPPSATDVQAAITRLASARATGDRPLFQALTQALAASGLEDAQRTLVELMTDDSIPDLDGEVFLDGLRDSGVPGIAAAAQTRVRIALANGVTTGTAGIGWFDLILKHGDQEQLDWVLSEEHGDSLHTVALRALVRSPAPAAIRRSLMLFETGSLDATLLDEFANHQPRLAFELIHSTLTTGTWHPAGKTDNRVAAVYGRIVPPERLVDARVALLALSAEGPRIAAVYAVQALAERSFDPSEFQEILLVPVEILERGSRGDLETAEWILVSSARLAIESNPVTWSTRSAAALEATGRASEALRVRAALRAPWRRW